MSGEKDQKVKKSKESKVLKSSSFKHRASSFPFAPHAVRMAAPTLTGGAGKTCQRPQDLTVLGWGA